MKNKDYVVVVQCHIVKERCSGYFCEQSFYTRSGAFSSYPPETETGSPLRFLSLTCGGCCGRAVHRKLMNLLTRLKQYEGIEKERVCLHLSSCVAFESQHGPPCPHKDYLQAMVKDKLGLDLIEGSKISTKTEERRKAGIYQQRT